MGWVLTGSRLEAIPDAIREHLGAVDSTKYSPAYLAENQGTIIALQMDGEKPDFYIIGKAVFETDYSTVDVATALEQNPELAAWIKTRPQMEKMLAAKDGALVGARKSVQVEMIKLSALGYGMDEAVTIQSPWGEQTKPAGQEAYLARDRASGEYYLVNQGEDGNPLSYAPVR